ncbi:multidrug transporter [Lysinibacillus sp. SGAir0095]|uniref:multidrug transporter n=1 Tax=Lysinibacillus sp. SGAir0095 TaxID=2070463 RepID=UPI0010CD4A19|nr:multidrug transporter [Lysinibacillus sp. SGAir0095]QCR31051.1 multidrug transporter [Lysinibacillus sp. SGAir0095]
MDKNKTPVPHIDTNLNTDPETNDNEKDLNLKDTIAKNKEIIEKNRNMLQKYRISPS